MAGSTIKPQLFPSKQSVVTQRALRAWHVGLVASTTEDAFQLRIGIIIHCVCSRRRDQQCVIAILVAVAYIGDSRICR